MLRVQPGSALQSNAEAYDSDELADSWRCAVVRNLIEAGETAGRSEDPAAGGDNGGGSSGSCSNDNDDDDDDDDAGNAHDGGTPVQPIIARAPRKSTPRYFNAETRSTNAFCPPPAGVHSNVCFLCGGRDHSSYACPAEICMVMRLTGLEPLVRPRLRRRHQLIWNSPTCVASCAGLLGARTPQPRLPNCRQDHSLQPLRPCWTSTFGLPREADEIASESRVMSLCGLRRLWPLGLSVDVGQSSALVQLP